MAYKDLVGKKIYGREIKKVLAMEYYALYYIWFKESESTSSYDCIITLKQALKLLDKQENSSITKSKMPEALLFSFIILFMLSILLLKYGIF